MLMAMIRDMNDGVGIFGVGGPSPRGGGGGGCLAEMEPGCGYVGCGDGALRPRSGRAPE